MGLLLELCFMLTQCFLQLRFSFIIGMLQHLNNHEAGSINVNP